MAGAARGLIRYAFLMTIITLNAGSSSIKFAAFDNHLSPLAHGMVEGFGEAALAAALAELEGLGISLTKAAGIGHRVVHGGTEFVEPIIVSDEVQARLETLRKLAPLHLPYGLSAMVELRRRAPSVPHIACFDTAFHAGREAVTTRLPLPVDFEAKGYRRYGFHGLNYEHIVYCMPQQTGSPLPARLIVAHLGSGCSICAIREGRSVETTMGFSTADGLMMGTRTGAIDPGVLVALLRDEHLTLDELEDLLYRKSGLLGVSGDTADMRKLLASPAKAAQLAVDMFCYQAARHAASLAVSLGGVDAIVFTGGIGENSKTIRERIMHRLEFLGSVPVHVVKANEELTIARHVSALVRQR